MTLHASLHPSAPLFQAKPAEGRYGDRYLAALLLAVAAYGFTGKGFAYAGVAPAFPAEVLLCAGLPTLVRSLRPVGLLASGANVLLALLMAWTMARTIPFIGVYGVDAPRDSVIVMYGLFAFVVANLVLERPSRVERALHWAARYFSVYGALAFALYVLTKQLDPVLPRWPGTEISLISVRGGEVAVQLGGAVVFALLGLKRSSSRWICMVLLACAVVSAQSRGGMLSIVVPLSLAMVLSGRYRAPLLAVAATLPMFAILYATDLQIPLDEGRRPMTVPQLVDNVASIVVSSDAGSGDKTLDDNKMWRLRWWSQIFNYTLHGPYYWTGKGFGVGLAVDDGFRGTSDPGAPPLRAPHSAHMNILARTGLPGFVLWIATGVTWLVTMLRGILLARLRGDREWAHVFIFVMCEWIGAVIDASFDVTLEAPMVGVVFWVLFGAGIGLTMTYDSMFRARKAERAARKAAW